MEWDGVAWFFQELTPETYEFPVLVVPNSGGALGSNGSEFGRLEYVVLELIGLLSESLDTPPMGDE